MPKRFSFSAGLVLICVVLVFVSNARSQSTDQPYPPPRPEAGEMRFAGTVPVDAGPSLGHSKPLRVDVDLVLVPVTVTDPMNRPVLELQKQDFKVYENNQLQQIQYFSAEETPISVGLLLDMSRSMANKFVIERAAAEEFFKNANPQDDYFVVTFADRPQLLTSSIQSVEDMQQVLASDTPDGHTALLDAIYMAIAKMRNARYQRRALVIISDGGDNHSRYGLKEIRKLVEEADVEVYAVGMFDSALFRSFEEFMGKRWLAEITDVSGGETVAAAGLEKVPEIAATISRQMRTQYVLGYRPQSKDHGSKWRKIKVDVTSSPGSPRLQAHYKKGYAAAAR
jgi:Ca-activated chloride channel family protein